MPIEWGQESFHAKELKKWNTPKRDGGYNANGYEPFPAMLYKAQIHPISNKYEVALRADVISLDKTVVLLSAEAFNSSCQMTVKNEEEMSRAIADGWRKTQHEAMDLAEGREQEKAVEAAVRADRDRKMSEAAQADLARRDVGPEHTPEIKALPVKKGWSEERRAKQAATIAARKAKA